jgi:hypothetical protein
MFWSVWELVNGFLKLVFSIKKNPEICVFRIQELGP